MADAVVDYQATNLFDVGANFKTISSTTNEPTTNAAVMDELGNVVCQTNIEDITNYTQSLSYCGNDFLTDFVDGRATPVSFLENFGCVFDSKIVTAISIKMTAAGYVTVDITGHNHAVNAHDAGATPTGATRSSALALGICDVSDFLPHAVAEAFKTWDGFGVPDFGVTLGANSTPNSATVNFSFGSHADVIDESGDHFVGKNITPKCELSMDFIGVPTSNTIALLNADFAANTGTMLGAITDSVDGGDASTSNDTFAFTAHANPALATV